MWSYGHCVLVTFNTRFMHQHTILLLNIIIKEQSSSDALIYSINKSTYNFFLLGSFTGVAHYFDALFWHPHASSQHYVPVSPLRAIQFQMRWEHRRLSALRRARTRDRCRYRIPSPRQQPLSYCVPTKPHRNSRLLFFKISRTYGNPVKQRKRNQSTITWIHIQSTLYFNIEP